MGPRTALLLSILMLGLAAPAGAEARLIEDVDYGGSGDPYQTFDLYLPDADAPPLLVFVHSRFWSAGERARDVASRFARPLQRAGAAVAVVRHRPADAAPFPAAAEDVASAIARLLGEADRHGFDADRVYLAGHGSGGHLAALVALDTRWLAAHDLHPDALAGVAALSGAFALENGEEALAPVYARVFGNASARRDASPRSHVRGDAPPFLLLVAQQDLPGADVQAAEFAEALRDAGHPAAEMFVLPDRDHWTALDVSAEASPARQHLLSLLALPGATSRLEDVFGTRRYWRDPEYTTLPFWEAPSRIVRYEADDWFRFTLNLPFARPGRPPLLRPTHYHALDLLDHVAREVPGGDGPWRYLTLTNVRGEQVVWRRDEIEPLAPRLVVGIDDRRELFQLTDTYHTMRRYTWKGEEESWVLARPLGAFVHFPEPPPAPVDPKLFGRFGLQPGAFAVSTADPLAPLRDLPDAERTILTEELRCVSCHRFRGVGARAGHLRARDGELVGGFGLALESYPPEVWRRYCFSQVEVAAEIGATPVPLGALATTLYELVERERGR